MAESRTLRVAHLYGSMLNLYGDRGNILTLKHRCEQRGIGFDVADVGLGERLMFGASDLIFVGGGPDREQRRVADDIVALKGEPLKEAAAEGVVILAVCGGYQLLGHSYREGSGAELKGVGVFDLQTVHAGNDVERCIGNVVVEMEIAELSDRLVVGFENHGGRTHLGPGSSPLARVVVGYGNNGEDGWEGARTNNAFGTYIHGSLLPKNPAFADYLIELALGKRYGAEPLRPLDDSLERRAREVAMRIARSGGRRPSKQAAPA